MILRAGIPIAVLLVLGALVASQIAGPAFDLQLAAPRQAQPGSEVALRAFLFEAGEASLLEGERIEVALRAQAGEELDASSGPAMARTTLRSAGLRGYEGKLALPARQGSFFLDARVVSAAASEGRAARDAPAAREDEGAAAEPEDARDGRRVRRRIEIREAPDLRSDRRPRLQTALQRFELGPKRRLAAAQPGERLPRDLEGRIVGGACSPERRCTLAVWVGAPAAAVALAETRSVKPLADEECGVVDADEALVSPSEPSESILLCRFDLRGSEAETTLYAHREGRLIAARRLQLPIVLGAPDFSLDARFAAIERPVRLEMAAVDADRTIILDAYRDDIWAETLTRETSADLRWSPPASMPGLWRLQVRGDAFDRERVGVRMLVAVPPGTEDPLVAALATVAAHPAQQELLDPLAREEGLLDCQAKECERRLSFMLALFERELAVPPIFSRGREQAEGSWRRVRHQRQVLAGLFILFLGALVAFGIFRAGRRAQAQAEVLEAQAGRAVTEALAHPANERGTREATEPLEVDGQRDGELDGLAPRPAFDLRLWASSAFVFMAFAAAASLLLARGCLYGDLDPPGSNETDVGARVSSR